MHSITTEFRQITTNERYQIQFFVTLLRYVTAFKKNVRCGEKIPTTSISSCVTPIAGRNVSHRPARSVLRVSKRIYCLSDDLIISPLTVSELPGLLREFSIP
jgi:hypothetical protein